MSQLPGSLINAFPLNDSCSMFRIFWKNKIDRQKGIPWVKMLEVLWWFDLVDALYINIGPWAGRSFFSFQRQMAGTPYNLRHFFYNFLLFSFQSELNSIPHLWKQIISKIGSRVLFKMDGDNPKKVSKSTPLSISSLTVRWSQKWTVQLFENYLYKNLQNKIARAAIASV